MTLHDRDQLLRCQVAIILALVVSHVGIHFLQGTPLGVLRNMLDLGVEANVPTWFSSVQLFAISLLAIFYSLQVRDSEAPRFYQFLGIAFLFLSMDEASQLHERATVALRSISIHALFPGGEGTWMPLYAAAVLTCLLLLRRSVSAFWRERRGRLALVAGVLVAGSGGVGAEVVHYYMEYFGDPGPLAEVIQVAVEEGLELVGETVIIFGMLTKVVGLQPGGGDSRRVEEAHGRA